MTINEIIEQCGGAANLAKKCDLELTSVYKWKTNGIRDFHWDTIIKLADIDAETIYKANQLLLEKRQQSASSRDEHHTAA